MIDTSCYDIYFVLLSDVAHLFTQPKEGRILSLLSKRVSGMKCMQFQYNLPPGALFVAGGLDTQQKNPFTSPFFGSTGTTIYRLPSTGSEWETGIFSSQSLISKFYENFEVFKILVKIILKVIFFWQMRHKINWSWLIEMILNHIWQ